MHKMNTITAMYVRDLQDAPGFCGEARMISTVFLQFKTWEKDFQDSYSVPEAESGAA